MARLGILCARAGCAGRKASGRDEALDINQFQLDSHFALKLSLNQSEGQIEVRSRVAQPRQVFPRRRGDSRFLRQLGEKLRGTLPGRIYGAGVNFAQST